MNQDSHDPSIRRSPPPLPQPQRGSQVQPVQSSAQPQHALTPAVRSTPVAPAQYPQQVRAKNPGAAAVLSALWTGAGQIYNGQIGLGLLFMCLQFVNALLLFVLIGFVTLPLTWIIAIVQAYQRAQNFNSKHGIIS